MRVVRPVEPRMVRMLTGATPGEVLHEVFDANLVMAGAVRKSLRGGARRTRRYVVPTVVLSRLDRFAHLGS